jgi:acyl carrier protein
MKTREQLLELIKTLALAIHQRETRASQDEIAELRQWMDRELTSEAPLASLGWDSIRMTWLLVRLEEELDIDTSKLSLYELFTVGDLLDRLTSLGAKAG